MCSFALYLLEYDKVIIGARRCGILSMKSKNKIERYFAVLSHRRLVLYKEDENQKGRKEFHFSIIEDEDKSVRVKSNKKSDGKFSVIVDPNVGGHEKSESFDVSAMKYINHNSTAAHSTFSI